MAEAGGTPVRQRNLLGVLAFDMHGRGQGTRLIHEDELRRTLTGYLLPQEGAEQTGRSVDAFVAAARHLAGAGLAGACILEQSNVPLGLHRELADLR